MPSTSPMARLVAKTVLNLGMSIASHSMLPIERSERLYTTAEDTVPIMFKANMVKSEVYDPILQEVNTEEKIDGYLNEPMYANFTQGHFFLIVAAPGCLPIETKIMTPNGLKKLKELNSIENILSFNIHKNKIEPDIAIKQQQKKKQMYKIMLESSKELISSSEHKWFSKIENVIEKVRTQDLNIGNLILTM